MDDIHPLQRYREEQEMTQDELAKQLGVNRATIWRWEKGKRYPDRELWPRIREVTGIPAAELLGVSHEEAA